MEASATQYRTNALYPRWSRKTYMTGYSIRLAIFIAVNTYDLIIFTAYFIHTWESNHKFDFQQFQSV